MIAAAGHRRRGVEVASAHLYEQSRRDAFNRLAARDALMVDAEPQRARRRAGQPLSRGEARRHDLSPSSRSLRPTVGNAAPLPCPVLPPPCVHRTERQFYYRRRHEQELDERDEAGRANLQRDRAGLGRYCQHPGVRTGPPVLPAGRPGAADWLRESGRRIRRRRTPARTSRRGSRSTRTTTVFPTTSRSRSRTASTATR